MMATSQEGHVRRWFTEGYVKYQIRRGFAWGFCIGFVTATTVTFLALIITLWARS